MPMPITGVPDPYTSFVAFFQYRGDWWKLEVGVYIRLYRGRHRLDAPEEEQLWELELIK